MYETIFEYLSSLGIVCKDKKLFLTAITHCSFNYKLDCDIYGHNASLSMLGSKFFKAIYAKYVFSLNYRINKDVFSDNLKNSENRELPYKICVLEKICDFIRVGNSVNVKTLSNNVFVNVFYAIVGAVLIDSGVEKCEIFLMNLIKKYIGYSTSYIDYKSKLQEYVQAVTKDNSVIIYDSKSSGPSNNPTFYVTLKIGNKVISNATGNSRRKSEFEAAKIALTNKKDLLDSALIFIKRGLK